MVPLNKYKLLLKKKTGFCCHMYIHIKGRETMRSKEKKKKKKNGGCSVVKLEAIDSTFSSF